MFVGFREYLLSVSTHGDGVYVNWVVEQHHFSLLLRRRQGELLASVQVSENGKETGFPLAVVPLEERKYVLLLGRKRIAEVCFDARGIFAFSFTCQLRELARWLMKEVE